MEVVGDWRGWDAVHMPHWMQTSTTRWLRVIVCLVLTIEVHAELSCNSGQTVGKDGPILFSTSVYLRAPWLKHKKLNTIGGPGAEDKVA